MVTTIMSIKEQTVKRTKFLQQLGSRWRLAAVDSELFTTRQIRFHHVNELV